METQSKGAEGAHCSRNQADDFSGVGIAGVSHVHRSLSEPPILAPSGLFLALDKLK